MPNHTEFRAASQPGDNPGPAYVHIGNVVRDGLIYLSVDLYEDGYDELSDKPDLDDHNIWATAWLTRQQVVELIAALAAKLTTPPGGN